MSALERWPDLALTDHHGNERRLSGLVGAPAAPAGRVIERYGADQLWPGDRVAA